jgi:hypothetical protein
MMDTYTVTEDDLELTKEESAVLFTEREDAHDSHKIKWQLGLAVSQFCGVQIFRTSGEVGLKVIGMESDVGFALWLLEHLADFVHAELYAHLIGCLAPKSERKLIIKGFVLGCCERIQTRMLELCERSNAAQTSNGRELVVIKSGAIDAKLKELGIRLSNCGGGSSNYNDAARVAGGKAGDRASFGRPVGGPAGVLRLGRN